MNLFKSLLSVALLAGASSAFAAITFDFTENRGYTTGTHTYISTDGNYFVDVSPKATRGTPYLASASQGLYIYTVTNKGGDSSHQIDGKGPNESVVLDFLGKVVKLISATFSYIGSNDDFNLIVDGNEVLADVDPGNSFYNSVYNFNPQYAGGTFEFLADGKSDDFKLKSVTVEYADVPEPGSLVLLGLGLLGLGLARMKSRS